MNGQYSNVSLIIGQDGHSNGVSRYGDNEFNANANHSKRDGVKSSKPGALSAMLISLRSAPLVGAFSKRAY